MTQTDPQKGTLPRAEAHDLAALVDLLPDAVVSRTLVKRPTGNITLFAFDEGQGLSEHTAPFDAFVQMVTGTAELIIGGQPVMAKAGQVVVMPAGVPHAVRAVSPLKMLLVMIRDAV